MIPCISVLISSLSSSPILSHVSVKEIQGTSGVHIVLDPQQEDCEEVLSSFDLRLPLSGTPKGSNGGRFSPPGTIGGYGMGPTEPNVEAVPLITVRVVGLGGRSTDVSVVTNYAGSALGEYYCPYCTSCTQVIRHSYYVCFKQLAPSLTPSYPSLCPLGGGGSNWGVSSLLLFVDPSSINSFSLQDRDTLLRGEAIVSADPKSGKVVIRVYPLTASSLAQQISDRFDDYRFDKFDFDGLDDLENDRSSDGYTKRGSFSPNEDIGNEQQAGNTEQLFCRVGHADSFPPLF